METTVRRLTPGEIPAALELAKKTFMEFEAPDYSQEGVDTFMAFASNPEYITALKSGQARSWGGFTPDGRLAGMLAMRTGDSHVSMVFTACEYHRMGVMRCIWSAMCAELRRDHPELREITLNASPYGLPFYLRIGLEPVDDELLTDGIRYTPMRYSLVPDEQAT